MIRCFIPNTFRNDVLKARELLLLSLFRDIFFYYNEKCGVMGARCIAQRSRIETCGFFSFFQFANQERGRRMEKDSVLYVVIKTEWRDPFCYDGCHSEAYSEKTSVLCVCFDYASAAKYVEQDGASCPYEMKWAGKNANRWYYGYGPIMNGMSTGDHGTRYEIKETTLR